MKIYIVIKRNILEDDKILGVFQTNKDANDMRESCGNIDIDIEHHSICN